MDDAALPTGLVCEVATPQTWEPARSGPHNHLWMAATDKEMSGHHTAGTFVPAKGGGGGSGGGT